MPSDQDPTVEEVRELLEHAERCEKYGTGVATAEASVVVSLCRAYLAAREPPQMTAGEFAGLVVSWFAAKRDESREDGKPYTELACLLVVRKIRELGAEHNIEIVERPLHHSP